MVAPPIEVRPSAAQRRRFVRSRWFLVGWIVAVVAWGLHVGALSLAPLSIVQAVLSGGLVFLAVFAERFFGFHLGRRQWVGVTITAAGLVVIRLTNGGANDPARLAERADRRRGRDLALSVALVRFRLAAMCFRASRAAPRRPPGRIRSRMSRSGRLTQAAPGPLLGLLSRPLTAMIAGVISFYTSARSLQIGEAVEVIHDHLGGRQPRRDLRRHRRLPRADRLGPLEIGARFLAFCLVIAGAALMPAPMRCPDAASTPSRQQPRHHYIRG